MHLRECGRCETGKPEQEFTPSQWRFTRGRPWCRDCSHAYYQARRDGLTPTAQNRVRSTCATCGTSIEHRAASARFCSPRCRRNAFDESQREPGRSRNRVYLLRHKYGIDLADRDRLLRAQGGRCAICGTDEPGTRGWYIDHCHTTGEVRGLLCPHCNTGLGRFRDDPEVLGRAIAYLADPPARAVLTR